jgi:heme oxygenase
MTDLAMPVVIPFCPDIPEMPIEAVSPSLSLTLRSSTKVAHKEVELRLALPDSIFSVTDYRACLTRFYQLYRPMESDFQRCSEWTTLGMDASGSCFSNRLAADLSALGASVAEIPDAPAASLPPMPHFASALGARYVMEGSALGGQYMLPQLQRTLGDGMTGADSFFRGRGRETGAFWQLFREALDRYGNGHPEQVANVVASAIATFAAVGLWMRP